jgi:hypothetical protein
MLTDYTALVQDENDFILDADDMTSIEISAAGLSVEQCLHVLGMDKDDLSEDEYKIVVKIHKRGEAKAISDATSKLFSSMSNKGGSTAALEYLKAMSERFASEPEQQMSGSGFSFITNINKPAEVNLNESSD